MVEGVLTAVFCFAAGLAVGVLIGRPHQITVNNHPLAAPAAPAAPEESDANAEEEDDAGGDWWEHGRKPLGDAG